MKIGLFKTHKKNEPLHLCKERKRFIKSAIDSRHDLAASHVSYTHSLRSVAIALRRYAEAEALLDSSSLSVSDSTLSQFTYPSPPSSSTSRVGDVAVSESSPTLHSEGHVICTMSSRVTVRSSNDSFLDDEFPDNADSWDFFDPCSCEGVSLLKDCMNSDTNEETVTREREDPSEFITHRAKDFLSSIKVIENRFVRAFESGREVSRLLEANKIMVGYSHGKGKSSAMALLKAIQNVCYGKAKLVSKEPVQKIISWRRIVPSHSQSSSSWNQLVTTSKKHMDDTTESDFVEESCMISGSHSCTLDRLYAWERKLYDEVKASEFVRKKYDKKCNQLRHQFTKDHGTQAIDKTRLVVKDLHSRIKVAIYSFDSISKQIEKVRDEELLPQLLELNQGLISMWRDMLECHHSQYITISLAYHSRNSTRTLEGDARKAIKAQLLQEFKSFALSFDDLISNQTSYVESLNTWLQNCILQPREHSSKRRTRPFSPRRVLAPPIFVLCRDWSAGIKSLPHEDLSNAIKNFVSDLCLLMEKQEKHNLNVASIEESKSTSTEDDFAHLCCIHTNLTKVLSQLTKFSEASLKKYEDIRQKSEVAQAAYHNCRSIRTGKF